MTSNFKKLDNRITIQTKLSLLLALALTIFLSTHIHGQVQEIELLDNKQGLSIGERLSYHVIEEREAPIIVFVNSDGHIELPYIGKVYSKGKTCRQLAYEIKQLLEVDFFHQATVQLSRKLSDNTLGEITILGEVNRQGKHKIPSDKIYYVSHSIIEAAAGFKASANKNEVIVVRRDPKNKDREVRIIIDVGGVIQTGKYEYDIPVKPDDTIIVPPTKNASGQVYIAGEVKAPGLYNIPQDQKFTVSRAILAAGGFTDWAKGNKVKLIRGDPKLSDKERTIIVNVENILNRNQRDNDPIVQPDDVIKVPEAMFKL